MSDRRSKSKISKSRTSQLDWTMNEANCQPRIIPEELTWFMSLQLRTMLFFAVLWSTIRRSKRLSNVQSSFSSSFSKCHSKITFNWPSLVLRISWRIVDASTPFVGEQRWWFAVRCFNPGGKSSTFVRLVAELLIELSIADLFHRFDIVDGNEMDGQIHLNSMAHSLKARRVRSSHLMRENASCRLSSACSIKANSSLGDWLKRDLTLYASFKRSKAKRNNFVSCLLANGGNGIGEKRRDARQWTTVV